MDYLIKTKPRSWKLEELYFQYKQSGNSFQDARAKLKSDLNDLIQSELTSDKAKKSMKALLENSEVNCALKLKIYVILLTHAFRYVFN